MKEEKNNFTNIERKVQSFFKKQKDSFRVGKDFWSKLEPKLEAKVANTEPKKTKGRLWQWLAGPRLIAISSSLAVVLILIVAGSLWLTSNNSSSSNTSSSMVRPPVANGSLGAIAAITSPLVINTAVPTTSGITTTQAFSGSSGSGNVTFGTENSVIPEATGQQVISQASVTLEVTTVSTAITQVETIAQNLGGSVDNMSSTGDQNQEQANITIRVPQNQFLTALNQLQSLGTMENQNVSSQDVTQQYIDLQAQLNSAQLEEQSLQAILAKATTVSDEIAIQEQLTQVISQVQSLQGQINYLQNQVAMSTITVNLNTPTQTVGQPPSGTLDVTVSNVDNTLASVQQLVTGVKGIINSSTVSYNNGKESATLSLQVYSANFDQVMTAIEKYGKTQQKTIQESGTSQQTGTPQSNSPPDASISLTLNQANGFWTATVITIIIATGVILLILIIVLVIVGRAGLLRKSRT